MSTTTSIRMAAAVSPWSAASSNHPGGVNVLFMDGSVRFIKNPMNYRTWYAIATPNKREAVSSDALWTRTRDVQRLTVLASSSSGMSSSTSDSGGDRETRFSLVLLEIGEVGLGNMGTGSQVGLSQPAGLAGGADRLAQGCGTCGRGLVPPLLRQELAALSEDLVLVLLNQLRRRRTSAASSSVSFRGATTRWTFLDRMVAPVIPQCRRQ